MQQSAQPQQAQMTIAQMQQSLSQQLSQALLKLHETEEQLDALAAQKNEIRRQVKMIKDTLNGLNLSAQALPFDADAQNSTEEINVTETHD